MALCCYRAAAIAAMVLAAGAGCCGVARADGDNPLPLPRFASLHADKVHLRAGPGPQYPVEWDFVRKDLPVEIVKQFEHWRRIRDWQGTQGWVHERMLEGRRGVIVTGTVRALYRSPDANSPVVARAEPGVVARLLECDGEWCRIDAGEATGWLRRGDIWGVYPNETVP